VGGVTGGLAYATLQWNADLWHKYRLLALGFVLPVCAFAFAISPWLLGALLFLSGLFVTPIYSNAYLLVDKAIPERVRHEANTWLGATTDLANGASAIAIGAIVAGGNFRLALVVFSGYAVASLILVWFWRVPRDASSATAAVQAGLDPSGQPQHQSHAS
jgi:MFS family permease